MDATIIDTIAVSCLVEAFQTSYSAPKRAPAREIEKYRELFATHRFIPLARGVHPPEAMMHFSLVSNFPLFPKNISDFVENFQSLTFSEFFLDIHPPQFLITFLVVD